jgi:hypothetical protein
MATGGGGKLSRRSGTDGIEIEIENSLAAAAGVVGGRKGEGKGKVLEVG